MDSERKKLEFKEKKWAVEDEHGEDRWCHAFSDAEDDEMNLKN